MGYADFRHIIPKVTNIVISGVTGLNLTKFIYDSAE